MRQEFKLIVGLARGDDGLDPRRNKQRRRWYPSTTSDVEQAGDLKAGQDWIPEAQRQGIGYTDITHLLVRIDDERAKRKREKLKSEQPQVP